MLLKGQMDMDRDGSRAAFCSDLASQALGAVANLYTQRVSILLQHPWTHKKSEVLENPGFAALGHSWRSDQKSCP